MSLSDRIREAREAAHVTLETVGKACGGKSAQAVHAWETGRTTPRASDLAIIAALTRTSLNWLISGVTDPDTRPNDLGMTGRVVPTIAWKSVQDYVAAQGRVSVSSFARSHFECGPRAFQTIIEDRSNAPDMNPGDSIIVDPDLPPAPGDYVLVLIPPTGPLLRRYRARENAVELAPANPDWSSVTLSALEPGVLVGTVTEHARPRRR